MSIRAPIWFDLVPAIVCTDAIHELDASVPKIGFLAPRIDSACPRIGIYS